jgi:hypothetical protein
MMTDPMMELHDPGTSAVRLSELAGQHPQLAQWIIAHPNCYPALREWGETVMRMMPAQPAAPEQPRGPEPSGYQPQPHFAPYAAAMPDPTSSSATPAGYASAPGYAAPAGYATPAGYASAPGYAAPAGYASPAGYAATSPPPQRKRRRGLWIGAIAAVLVVAVAGSAVATKGFGLLGGTGGSKTPEGEMLQVATRTFDLINSIDGRSLLNNPLSVMNDLNADIAPSEQSLMASNVGTNLINELGISKGTIDELTSIIGSFSVHADALKVAAYHLTDDIALGRVVGGTVTVSADATKLRAALAKAPDVIDAQLLASAKAFGLTLNINAPGDMTIGEAMFDNGNPNWVDDVISNVNDTFPMTLDLEQLWTEAQQCAMDAVTAQSRYWSDCPDDVRTYLAMSGRVLVQENGRWYLSGMMAGSGGSSPAGMASMLGTWGSVASLLGGFGAAATDYDRDVYSAISDQVEQNWNQSSLSMSGSFEEVWPTYTDLPADTVSALNVTGAENDSPLAAANAMATALSRGDERGILRQLPLAERRFLGYIGLFSGSGDGMPISGTPRFTQVSRSGNQAIVSIQDLRIKDDYDDFEVTNGSCLRIDGEEHCVQDALDSDLTSWLDDQFPVSSDIWDTIGMDPYDVKDKLSAAIQAAAAAVNVDEIGLVTVQEDGSWYVSVSATAAHLESQALDALVVGLKAAKK